MRDLKQLRAILANGSIDRREFMWRATAIGVSGVMANTIVSQMAVAQTPTKGGHLILGLNGPGAGDSPDPGTYAATHGQVCGHPLYNFLLETDDKVNLV